MIDFQFGFRIFFSQIKLFEYLVIERPWLMLFQKLVVRIKFDIYVFIHPCAQ
jgi:hypothetical protein